MTWRSLCDGEGLRQCATCRRNADNQPLGVLGEHQSYFVPLVQHGSCADYEKIPPEVLESKL